MRLSLLPVLLLCACGSKAAPRKDPTPIASSGPADKKEAKPTESSMEQVSPSLSASSKLLALCTIQRQQQVPPTFDYDKADLAPADRQALDEIATCLISGPAKGKKLMMVGRADPRGTQEYNMGLGAHRARNVSVYLKRLGVEPVQLAENTRGDLDADGTDEESWRRDRRVDLDLE